MTPVSGKIDALDLEVVKLKLTMPPEEGGYGWPVEETDHAILAYRQFLKQVLSYRAGNDAGEAMSKRGPAPDAVTDIVWHTHILFTEKYHRDCEALFGEYIHHRPRVGTDVSADHHPVGA